MNPRTFGARCDECPLQGCSDPVPPEVGHVATIAVVGKAPGDPEVREGRPMIGPAGKSIMDTLRREGVSRGECHLTSVVLCQPPANDLKKILTQVQRDNQAIVKVNIERAKVGLAPNPLRLSPIEACRPRLAKELQGFRDVILLGGTAAKAVMGTSQSIMAIRGGMVDGRLRYDATANTLRVFVGADVAAVGQAVRIMPTFDPAFVQHAQRYTKPFRADVSRAVRWFRGLLQWEPPQITYNPSASLLRAFLARPGAVYSYDVETDGIEPLSARLRCFAIGDQHEVMVVGTRGIDGVTEFYPPGELPGVLDVIRAWLTDAGIVKVGHNAGSYDRMCCMAQLGVDPAPTLDTILLHRLVESELPHSLAFVGSVYTDVHAWKTDREGNKLAFGSETDAELHEYCALDVAVTARVMPSLYSAVLARGQAHLIEGDHRIQRICGDMHIVGMYVDQEVRASVETETLRAVVTTRNELRDLSGMADLNPGSTYALRRLLFDDWKLVPPVDDEYRFTATGDPSTSDDVIRGLLSLSSLKPEQRAFLRQIRNYRSKQKELGTYIVKLRPREQEAGAGWDEDETNEERAERDTRGYAKRGIVWPDGRMRPGYNAHVTVTGRLSSSRPINAQNFPKHLRRLVTAAPGHVLVGADADQIELRIAAARWGAKLYLGAFDAGADPHSMTALAVFGARFADADGWPPGERIMLPGFPTGVPVSGTKFTGAADKLRKLAKGVQYASQYKGSVETVQRLLQQTEDDAGELTYLHLTLREVRAMHQAWLNGAREFERGWDSEIESYRANGYISDPVSGRRRDCLDGENPNEIVNFPIQASAAALINTAMIQITEEIPLHRWGPGTGLLTQTHDSLVVECPPEHAAYVASVIESAMNSTHPALPGVRFTASADVGHSWNKVG